MKKTSKRGGREEWRKRMKEKNEDGECKTRKEEEENEEEQQQRRKRRM